MRRTVLLIALLSSLLLSSCAVGSREIVSRLRDVDDFTGIAMESVGELTVTQGDRFEVSVRAESNIVNRIETTVLRDTLHVRMSGGWRNWRVLPTRNIQVFVTMPRVAALQLSSVGSLNAESLRADTLRLQLTGAGSIVIRDLTATELLVQHGGLGRCEVAGQAQQQSVQLSGAGRYDAADLLSDHADVQVSGLGQVTVWATDTLNAAITGGGSIDYWGDPELTERITGLGRVRSLGPQPNERS